MSLYEHEVDHQPLNVNDLHQQEYQDGSLNARVAVWLTNVFSDMRTFWTIVAWLFFWIIANATIVRFDPMPWPLLLALASVPQLPLMIVIIVGQSILSRKQELQAEEQYRTTVNSYNDIEQIMEHLSRQDDLILQLLNTSTKKPRTRKEQAS